jgi:hypothetical protein
VGVRERDEPDAGDEASEQPRRPVRHRSSDAWCASWGPRDDRAGTHTARTGPPIARRWLLPQRPRGVLRGRWVPFP